MYAESKSQTCGPDLSAFQQATVVQDPLGLRCHRWLTSVRTYAYTETASTSIYIYMIKSCALVFNLHH